MQVIDFKDEVTVEVLLLYIVQSGGSVANEHPHIIMPRTTLEESSAFTKDTISRCLSQGLIKEVPFVSRASEYHITRKGRAYLRSSGKANDLINGSV